MDKLFLISILEFFATAIVALVVCICLGLGLDKLIERRNRKKKDD